MLLPDGCEAVEGPYTHERASYVENSPKIKRPTEKKPDALITATALLRMFADEMKATKNLDCAS